MTSEESNGFFQFLTACFHQVRGKDALSSVREKAWERFISIGLPQRKDEAFRYVPLRELYSALSDSQWSLVSDIERGIAEIKQAIFPESHSSHIVFMDGIFCPHLSNMAALPAGSVLLPLSQAMRSHGHFLQSHLFKGIKEEKDPFALLNLALHPSGLFLYIPPKQSLREPIHCLHVITKETAGFSASRIQLALGACSSLKWVSTYLTFNDASVHCASPVMDIFMDQGSHVDLICHLNPGASHWCFDSVRAYLKRDAIIKTLNVMSGSKTTRHSVYVQCAGENSEADLKGLWMLKSSLQAHTHAIVEHSAPHTRSMQLFKGCVFDSSQSSFEGKIIVRQAAQKTEAYQLNNNLILGEAAIAYSKPNLEVFADDVKASHGATISRPDEKQLFYLKSRGIDEALAQRLLMSGFYKEILDQIPYAHLRNKLILACDSPFNEVSL